MFARSPHLSCHSARLGMRRELRWHLIDPHALLAPVKPGKSRQISANAAADPRTSVQARSTDVWHDSGEAGARELLISTEQDNSRPRCYGAGCGRRRTNLCGAL